MKAKICAGTQGTPEIPPLPAISSGNTNKARKGRKTNFSFQLCCQMLLYCMAWEEESWPDGEEDPKGAGSPGTSAAHLCSQLCTVICLFSYTAPIWTGSTASFSGYTDHTLVWKANSGCDLAQGDGKWRECGSESGFAEDRKSLGIQVFWGVGSKIIYMYCLLLIEMHYKWFWGL